MPREHGLVDQIYMITNDCCHSFMRVSTITDKSKRTRPNAWKSFTVRRDADCRTVIFPTSKSGGVERMGHGSPVQWQTMILVSHLWLLRCFPFEDEMQEPATERTLVLTLPIQHNMEEESFKQPGSSENHAFPGDKPINCKLSCIQIWLLVRKRWCGRISFSMLLIT